MTDVRGSAGKRSPSRKESNLDNLSLKKGKGTEEVRETRVAHHTLNTIARGFSNGGGTNSARKRYARTIMHVS